MVVQVRTLSEIFGPGAEEELAKIHNSYEKLYQLLGLLQKRRISQREFFRRLLGGQGLRPVLVQVQHDENFSEWVSVQMTPRRKLRIDTNNDGVWLPRITFWACLNEKGRLVVTRTEAWFRSRDEKGGEVQQTGDYVPTDVIGQGYSKRETAKAILRAFLKATPPPERDD